ncbi:membrane protein [Striga asiatica]|uniref:Membrane protein n=1 Tax=Striga asiatica TaxID=4170 RepID=A0A5A7PE10_STRAF|nr:membrane protein [Striga asiatica]
MLFKGWHRLLHDLISREGPFLETACIPIAGLTILMWPLIVIGSILMAIFTSFFIGLYGSIVVYQVTNKTILFLSIEPFALFLVTNSFLKTCSKINTNGFKNISLSIHFTSICPVFISMQERSFRRGVAYVIAMVAEFDEYTNDWLYLREGSILPKPRYRKRKPSNSSELTVPRNQSIHERLGYAATESPGMIVPRLTASRSVREVMKEVKMVQIWGSMMKACEVRGKELLDKNVISHADLCDWLKAKHSSGPHIIDVGLPCYSFLHTLLDSIKVGSTGLVLLDGTEVNHLNRPQDRLMDWFFNPVLVLKEQVRALRLEEGEIRMMGMNRSVSKFPTHRRRYRQVVKDLIAYSKGKDCSSRSINYSATKEGSQRSVNSSSSAAKEGSTRSVSVKSVASVDIV